MKSAGSQIALLALSLLVVCVCVAQAAINVPPVFRDDDPFARSFSEKKYEDIGREAMDYRLPNDTMPTHYDIELTTEIHNGNLAFYGTVDIWLKVLNTTNKIVIHKRQTDINLITLKKRPTNTMVNVLYSYDNELEFLTISPTDTSVQMEEDSEWLLTIHYNGTLRQDNAGFYVSTYKDANNETKYLATTQFESTDARHAFPCYDEPAKRATFIVTINHNSAYKAISNMPVDETMTTDGRTVFQKTKSMPTYLVAFIVSDFEYSEGVLNNLPQRVYSRPGTKDQQEWALVSGMLLTERLANYYRYKFALPKLDQVAVPDFAAGAMENWGLATYREEYLLYDRLRSTVNTQTNVANIIAHEYTHQWFGNLVAIRWWTYLWLKEGFATLFSYEATDEAYPEWGIYQLFQISEYQRALNSDGFVNARPMTHYVQTPNEISALYDSVSYSKAGSVLRMWQHALGDAVFRDGLHVYLATNNYDSAVEEDLFDAIAIGAKNQNVPIPDTIEHMMSTWTRQGGNPLLIVKRDYVSGTFTISQETFLSSETAKANKTWYIPINYAIQSDADFRNTLATHYIKDNDMQINVTDRIPNEDWLILNKQSTGYYRINYDENNWQLITDGLLKNPYKIHTLNRAQLMHDAYIFTSSNRLRHDILLNLMNYLAHEDQYAPWSTAYNILAVFDRYLNDNDDYTYLQWYMKDLVEPIYEKLGVNDEPGEQHFQKNVRSIVINIACMAGSADCLQETNTKLVQYIDRGIEIEPNLQSQIYCNGLKNITNKYFDAIYDKLMASEDQAERRLLINSLGCSQNAEQLHKFISSSIDQSNALRTQERTTLLSPTYSRGSIGLLACIEFLNEHWEVYGSMTSGAFSRRNPLDMDIRGMSSYVLNDEQEKMLNELVQKVKNSEFVGNDLETYVKNNIQSTKAWISRNRDPVYRFVTGIYRNGSATLQATFLSIFITLGLLLLR